MSVDLQTAELLAALKPPPGTEPVAFADISAEQAREGARAVFLAFAGPVDQSCGVRDLLIAVGDAGTSGAAQDSPGGDGSQRERGPGSDVSGDLSSDVADEITQADIPARFYSPPQSAGQALPLVVFLHGGGWAMGDLDSYDALMRSLCVQSGACFLSIDYRRSPEHRFPAGLNDALRAIRWAHDSHQDLRIDPECIALMGDSAGGNLVAVAARRLHIESNLSLRAQFLIYPVLDVSRPHSAYPSRLSWGDGDYLLTRESIDVTLDWYLGDNERADNPAVSPLLAPDLNRMPPTVIVAAGCDPLLDESRHYADLLKTAGVPTTFRCFERTIHAFLSFGTLDVAQQARTWLAREIQQHLA